MNACTGTALREVWLARKAVRDVSVVRHLKRMVQRCLREHRVPLESTKIVRNAVLVRFRQEKLLGNIWAADDAASDCMRQAGREKKQGEQSSLKGSRSKEHQWQPRLNGTPQL